MTGYVVVFEGDDKSGYSAYSPDLPGVVAAAATRQETQALMMEAMAAGVPVVATRIAGIPELVRDGRSGLLVAPGDVNEMANAVDRLLADPELRNRFAIAARRDIEREFNIQTESRWLATILSSAIAGRSLGIRP